MFMACNGVLTPSKPAIVTPPPQIGNAPSPKIFYPPSPQIFNSTLRLEMAASVFFPHGYFQRAHVHISEAVKID